jgi:RNA polymerase subunit RPABC4/transcription elongation factor Spt4
MSDFRPEDILLAAAVYGGVILAAFWLAMVIWAYRDMRSRSRDVVARLLVALLVALLTLPGLLIYLLLRPRETLAEAYERSLEEEALLQDIEEKPVCPACGQRVRDDWQVCPHCHTRLKKPCISCGRPLEISWNICPHCASAQTSFRPGADDVLAAASAYPARPAQATRSSRVYPRETPAPETGQPLEFVEGDDL